MGCAGLCSGLSCAVLTQKSSMPPSSAHHEQHHLLFWAAHSGLVQAAHSALLQAQAPLPAQHLQALVHFLHWACPFFCSCWLELALFRLGWCALCRLSPPWFRRFWRFWSALAFASCCTALVQAQGLFLPSPAFPSPWLAAATCEFLFSFLCSHNWQPNHKAPNALVQAHPFESAFSFQTFFWLTLGPCSAT